MNDFLIEENDNDCFVKKKIKLFKIINDDFVVNDDDFDFFLSLFLFIFFGLIVFGSSLFDWEIIVFNMFFCFLLVILIKVLVDGLFIVSIDFM